MSPRGIRNHNPGNIVRTTPRTEWQGRVPDAELTDPRFEQFHAARWGIRALARTLITYQDKHRLRSVRAIITRWAPPIGRTADGQGYAQDTEAYIRHVARVLGRTPDEPIDVQQYGVMRPLVEALIRHENGIQPYSDAELDAGLRLAGVEPPVPAPSRDPEVAGGAAAAGGLAGATLVESATQLQLAGDLVVIKIVCALLIVVGVSLTLWARMRRRREGG